METNDKLVKLEKKLTPKELAAYRFLERHGQPRIAPSASAQFFELFLNGKTCADIAKLNPGFSLGQIVRARIEDEWDERKDLYVQELLENIREQTQRTQLESVKFLNSMLAATQKLWGQKVDKFIQTGDPQYMEDFPIRSVKDLKYLVEMFMMLTGQDKNKEPQQHLHKHTVETADKIPSKSGLTEKQAAAILKALEGDPEDE